MRLCYLILLHHKLEQATRMIKRLAGPDVCFVVHIDKVADALATKKMKSNLNDVGPIFYAKRVRAKWGSYGQVDAIVRSIQTAVLHVRQCERYILLSGQDYPIASKSAIKEFFAQHPEDEFLEARGPLDVMDETSSGWTPFYRFRRYHFWLGGRKRRMPLLKKSVPPIPVFIGSTWWALSKEAFLFLAEEIDRQREFVRSLKHGFLVDEILVPSLLMNSPFADHLLRKNVTYAPWTATSGPHPKTLTYDDLDQLKTSQMLFARKFDAAIDSKVLDVLDEL